MDIVTPGMPDTADIPKLSRLTGKVTPVNIPDIFTSAKVPTPINIPLNVCLIGRFDLAHI